MDKGQSTIAGAVTSPVISPVPTAICNGQYDVFLSFRGSNTHKTFPDHLYQSLVKAGTVPFCVFRDESSIPIDKELGSQILDAIIRSKISIPIISENYASSKCCLHELVCIMDIKKSAPHIVLPIFYKVARLDVRHLKGNFGDAFHLSQMHFEEKDIQEWQRALIEVSYLNGWESDKFAGHEGKLIEHVVETVISKLQEDFQLDLPKQLVGLDGHMKDIMNWSNNPSINARMLGIYGMDGIGKTTLARCIYNQLLSKFVHVSYLPDVRETTRRHGIIYLQRQLISDILQSKIEVSRIDDGIDIISSRFRGKKVLFLLDDIDDKNQLDALAGERDWFMAGSMILVTTRNEVVLDQSKFKVDYKFELNELDKEQALLLFNRHAFRMDHSPREFKGISRDIVYNIGGLPLALQVLGSYLYKKMNRKVWEHVWKQLENRPRRNVQEILRISYDALEDGYKKIFLDIVCFFIGEHSKFAVYMWEDCGFHPSQGIVELKLRCLIQIEDGVFKVHDQLRDLGMSIFCQGQPLERWSRLWDNNYKRVPRVLRHRESDLFRILVRAASSGAFKKLLSEVRWLDWGVKGSNLSFSMTNFHLPKLSVLDLSSSEITEDWEGWSLFMAAKQLKVLNLSCCNYISCTPDLSAFTQLKILILSNCDMMGYLHPSIGKLKSLLSLDLSFCENLKEVPEEVGKLKDLEELNLDYTGIREIPTSIGSLRKLKKLSAGGCMSLTEFPSLIWDLENLQDVDFSHSPKEKIPSDWLWRQSLGSCLSLKGEIPRKINNWSSLNVLNLSCCNYLRCTPDLSALKKLEILILKQCDGLEQVHLSIGKLKSLISLDLSDCGSLKELPEEVGELEQLKELILDSTGIIGIPTSIGSLRKLEKLSAYFCRSLREVPKSIGELQNLQDLNISHSAIEKLPGAIGMLKKLRRLSLQFCYRMKGEILSEIGDLSSLEILDITSTWISNLPKSIRNLSSLQCLSVWGCYKLRSLPELPSGLTNLLVSCQNSTLPQLSCLNYLEELDLYKCDLLEYIPELPSRLWKLCVASCHKLTLPKFEVFMYLEELSIKKCGSIKRLDLSIINRLKRLHAEDCYNLVEIQSHNNLDFLEEMVIDCCKSIGRLILPGLQCLKQLKANYCDNLVEIQGLGKAKFLEVLDISYCESIERLPDLSCFVALKELNINGCCNLRYVESLERFLFCRSIYITGCQSLEKLPNLSKFGNLENFTIRYSLGVTEVLGIEESRSLTHIDITGCISMEILPDLSGCDKLQSLVVRDCKKLTQLQGLEKLDLIYLDISGCDRLETIPKLLETCVFRNYERAQDEVLDGNIILQ